MFTGIVEEVGRVRTFTIGDASAQLEIACQRVLGGVQIGDSISVAGCCLTVTGLPGDGFTAELMTETLQVTTLGALEAGKRVNLERAMPADGRFGGHLVQGHVDGVGEVTGRDEQPGTVILTVRVPASVARYVVDKGSITIDGISLTVIDVVAKGARGGDGSGEDGAGGAALRVGLIPHTLDETTIGERAVGDRVNLEVDVVAKYVERLLQAGTASPYTAGVTGRA